MPSKRAPNHLRDFVKIAEEVEGVIQHVGRETWDLVLIDVNGRWVRDEFPTEDAAEAACRETWRADAPRMGRREDGSPDERPRPLEQPRWPRRAL